MNLQKAIDICRAAEQTRTHMDALKNATIPIDAVRKGPKRDREIKMTRRQENQ